MAARAGGRRSPFLQRLELGQKLRRALFGLIARRFGDSPRVRCCVATPLSIEPRLISSTIPAFANRSAHDLDGHLGRAALPGLPRVDHLTGYAELDEGVGRQRPGRFRRVPVDELIASKCRARRPPENVGAIRWFIVAVAKERTAAATVNPPQAFQCAG